MRRSIRAMAAALTVAIILPAVVVASWPVATTSSWISQGWHTYHRADDIAAAPGTPVLPIRDGTVVFAGWKSNCGGIQVWISHGNGLYSGYYHISSISSWKGEWVTDQTTTLGTTVSTTTTSGEND